MLKKPHEAVITDHPQQPELTFKIEVVHAVDAVLNDFKIFPENDHNINFPVPDYLNFPITINAGQPLELSIKPDLKFNNHLHSLLNAAFIFENCPTQFFKIEILKQVDIIHFLDINLIEENALTWGISDPRIVNITLVNQGDIKAVNINVKSLSNPWLTIDTSPNHDTLWPNKQSELSFSVKIDQSQLNIEKEDGVVHGEIAVYYHHDKSTEQDHVILNVGVEILHHKLMDFPLAIDFGNSGTCAAFIDDDFTPKIIALDNDYKDILEFPTIIEFNKFAPQNEKETGKGFVYGYQLEKTKYSGGDNFLHRVQFFKRNLGLNHSKFTRLDRNSKATRQFSSKEFISFYLKEVLQRFEKQTAFKPEEIIITYPASFSSTQISILSKIVSDIKSGIDVITEISEPEALAIHHLETMTIDKPETIFAVFDFGGGTTDISIGRLSYKNEIKKIKILISIGLDYLGGDTLTFELAKALYEKAFNTFDPAKRKRLFPDKFNDIQKISFAESCKINNCMNLMKEAEDLKVNKKSILDELMDKGHIMLNIHNFYFHDNQDPQPSTIQFTKDDFLCITNEHIKPGFQKLSDILEHLREYDILDKDEILDFVILGGNSSKLFLVKQLASDILKLSEDNVIFSYTNTKTAVVEGAAKYGMYRQSQDAKIIFENPLHLKFPLGDMDYYNRKFKVLFPAGSELGKAELKKSWNMANKKPVLNLYRNFDPSENSMNKNIVKITKYQLDRFKQNNQQTIEFTFRLEKNGIKISTDKMNDFIKIDL